MLTRMDIKAKLNEQTKGKKRKEKKCGKIIDLALERKKRDEIKPLTRSFQK